LPAPVAGATTGEEEEEEEVASLSSNLWMEERMEMERYLIFWARPRLISWKACSYSPIRDTSAPGAKMRRPEATKSISSSDSSFPSRSI
jgi:hypothetical protein